LALASLALAVFGAIECIPIKPYKRSTISSPSPKHEGGLAGYPDLLSAKEHTLFDSFIAAQ